MVDGNAAKISQSRITMPSHGCSISHVVSIIIILVVVSIIMSSMIITIPVAKWFHFVNEGKRIIGRSTGNIRSQIRLNMLLQKMTGPMDQMSVGSSNGKERFGGGGFVSQLYQILYHFLILRNNIYIIMIIIIILRDMIIVGKNNLITTMVDGTPWMRE